MKGGVTNERTGLRAKKQQARRHCSKTTGHTDTVDDCMSIASRALNEGQDMRMTSGRYCKRFRP